MTRTRLPRTRLTAGELTARIIGVILSVILLGLGLYMQARYTTDVSPFLPYPPNGIVR